MTTLNQLSTATTLTSSDQIILYSTINGSGRKASLNTIMVRAASPTPMQLPGTMPVGAGNKPWTMQGDPFMPEPVSPLLAGQDGPIEFE